MKQPKEEVQFCDTHKIWFTDEYPCKQCKTEKPKQEPKKESK